MGKLRPDEVSMIPEKYKSLVIHPRFEHRCVILATVICCFSGRRDGKEVIAPTVPYLKIESFFQSVPVFWARLQRELGFSGSHFRSRIQCVSPSRNSSGCCIFAPGKEGRQPTSSMRERLLLRSVYGGLV